MNFENYSLINYFQREQRFWETLRAVNASKDRKSKVFVELEKHFNDDFVMKVVEKRAKNLFSIISLFKKEYTDEVLERVNKEFKTNIKHLDYPSVVTAVGKPGLKGLKYEGEGGDAGGDLFAGVAIIFVVIIYVIIKAQKIDRENAVEQAKQDSVSIERSDFSIEQALVEKDKFFTCKELLDLDYYTWITYLVMVQAQEQDRDDKYMEALICAKCENLRILLQRFNYDSTIIIPRDAHVVSKFLYAMRLYECEIPLELA